MACEAANGTVGSMIFSKGTDWTLVIRNPNFERNIAWNALKILKNKRTKGGVSP